MPRESVFENGGFRGITRAFGESGMWNLKSAFGFMPVLYDFTSFTFTNGTQTGQTGPSQANLLAAYDSTINPWLLESDPENGNFFTCTSGIQEWVVPKTGTYLISAYGAQGGASSATSYAGGLGALMSGKFELEMGQKLKILVGQQGLVPTTNSRGGGGGGGSFVWDSVSSSPLIAAGGGGGAGNYVGPGFKNGVTTINAQKGAYQNSTADHSSQGAGGTNGNGGAKGTYPGGGCGWLSNGANGASPVTGGVRPLAGGAGGNPYNTTGNGNYGGFGGGGGSYAGAGGGGGYSGGGGGGWSNSGEGGGGGSYNDGTDQVNTAGANSGHGKVEIEFVG